jgi:ribosomal protein L11 methyltransferase
MNYIKVVFRPVDDTQKDNLMAWLLDIGFESFEEQECNLLAFIPQTEFNKTAIDVLSKREKLGYQLELIKQQNWNQIWESGFEPIQIGDQLAVRAGFHQPNENVGLELVITPKMSFGTGHHATTRLMLTSLLDMNCRGKTVFDFGTGTGILAILASKLGATSVLGIDNDEWSIDNAKENITNNQVDNIHIRLADSPPENEYFDIVLANINKHIIQQHLKKLICNIKTKSVMLLSGLLVNDENEIVSLLDEFSELKVTEINRLDQWICIKVIKN